MLNFEWLLSHDENMKTNENVPRHKYGTDLLLNYYTQYRKSAEHDQKLLNIMFHFNPGITRVV